MSNDEIDEINEEMLELPELPQIDPVENVQTDKSIKEECLSENNDESVSDLKRNSKDNLNDFKTDLEDKPEILAFIIRQGKRIRNLEKKVKKLKGTVKKYKSKIKSKSVSTQFPEEILDDVQIKLDDTPKSLTEEIKEAAENALLKTGFVYEPTSGMYYDYNTGYYYNAELGLYYDGNAGTYLVYNNYTKTYDFHSQVCVPKKLETVKVKEETGAKRKKQQKEQDKRVKLEKKEDVNLEEGECSDSENNNESELSDSSSEEEDLTELSKLWPPCMRIILKETTIEKLKIGSLYIITCDGGNIGREGEKSVIIPDINVSKNHADITFDKETKNYVITDLGSQNGTILNGKRISAPKTVSKPHAVVHGSIIQLGTTKLLCHIHDGQKTCGHCEPGLLQVEKPPEFEKPVNKSRSHKSELRRLRKKFGLETTVNNETNLAVGYSDRAEERRKKFGSHNENEKTQVASLHESIAADNKGFKMLAKMGWTEGQPLGKDGTGIAEPVAVVSNQGTTGLGSSVQAPRVPVSDRKLTVWKKAQERFKKVQDLNLDAFNESSDEGETKI